MKIRSSIVRFGGTFCTVIALGIVGVAASPPAHNDAPELAAPPKTAAEKPATKAGSHTPAHGEVEAETSGSSKPPVKTSGKGNAAEPTAKPILPPIDPVGSDDNKSTSSSETASAEKSLAMLIDANARWVAGKPTNTHIDTARRATLADKGQQPYATILTCSDSRLPAERLFDCGVGDIFVIRVAGNIMGESETGTIEYGLEHLHTPLLVVMGHTKCGAVSAAATDAHVDGSIASLVKHIDPAVDRARKLHPDLHDAEIIPEAIKENVWQSIFDLLKTSDITRLLVRENKVQIVGAVCDIATGKVEFLGEHPWQSELVTALSTPATTSDDQSTASASGH